MIGAALDGIDRELPCPTPLNNVNVYHLTAAGTFTNGRFGIAWFSG